VSVGPVLSLSVWALEFAKWTHKTLEPGPYWPDTGQAHTTCKALLVALLVVFAAARENREKLVTSFRLTRVFSIDVEDSAGMAPFVRTKMSHTPVSFRYL
jgi:hypothetical protein